VRMSSLFLKFLNLLYANDLADLPHDFGVHVEALEWIEPRERQTLRYERYVSVLCGLMPALEGNEAVN